ncbi:MAG: lasso peptide biosynthesis B2 protein [Bacteroidetes bacterium]|nr:lasso peptide biosynthesis B2 protein [Bacteroidota bacterium]
MNISVKFLSVYKIPASEKWIFLEAVYTSAYVRFSLSFLPFKKVANWLGHANIEKNNSQPLSLEIIKTVQQAVRRCNKYVPWKTECYTQALTGKILLHRRKISSTLFIGFMKDDEARYKGHAWLKVNEFFVTGHNSQLAQFQIHAFFS